MRQEAIISRRFANFVRPKSLHEFEHKNYIRSCAREWIFTLQKNIKFAIFVKKGPKMKIPQYECAKRVTLMKMIPKCILLMKLFTFEVHHLMRVIIDIGTFNFCLKRFAALKTAKWLGMSW